MYIILTPRRVASFFERFSRFKHTTLYRYRLINRCQPVPVTFSRPELVMPHLESALDAQLESWLARPICGATSVSCFTGETSISGIELETYSQSLGHQTKALALSFWTYSFRWVPIHQESEKQSEKIHCCWLGFELGPTD